MFYPPFQPNAVAVSCLGKLRGWHLKKICVAVTKNSPASDYLAEDDLIILIPNKSHGPCNDFFPLKVIQEWLLVYYIDIKR